MGKKVEITADAWSNVLTGLGVAGKDKNLGASIQWTRTDRGRCDGLYASDDIAGKIARLPPFDGTRAGITWKIPNSGSVESSQAAIDWLESEFDRLNAWERFFWAWTMARVYGGSCIYISCDDSKETDSPLVPNRVRKINNLVVMDRYELEVDSSSIITDLGSPDYGMPEFYLYQPSMGMGENAYVRIHHSRLIRFDGERLPDRLYVRNGYWHDSIFTKLYDAIRNYTTGQGSLSSVIQETNQAVYKIEGLHEAVSQDEDELIIKRMQIINNLRSSMRAIVLDKEDEFMFMQTALTGVSDLMGDLSSRLVAASEIPHTRLLGESPGASLGQNGRSELIDYYDMVASHQQANLRKPIERLKDVIFAQKSSEYTAPDGLVFSFNPLFQQDQEAMIRTRQIQATIDKMYMDQGVYYPDEVAFNRFASGEYSFETSLDTRERGIVEEQSATVEQATGEEDPANVAVKTAETPNPEG